MKKELLFLLLFLSIYSSINAFDIASYYKDKKMYVNSIDGLRLRNKPNGEILFILENGSSITIVEDAIQSNIQTIDNINGVWVKVKFYDDIGWIFSPFLVVSPKDIIKNVNPRIINIPFDTLNHTENYYDRLVEFMEKPIETLPSYTFGSISQDYDSGYRMTRDDLINEIKKIDGEYKIYSKNGPQGGNRWDTIQTKYSSIQYINYLNDQIRVMAVDINKNSTIKLRFFNEWPTKEAIIKTFGDFNYDNTNWYVYYIPLKNISLGFYHQNGEIKQIVIRQYLSD